MPEASTILRPQVNGKPCASPASQLRWPLPFESCPNEQRVWSRRCVSAKRPPQMPIQLRTFSGIGIIRFQSHTSAYQYRTSAGVHSTQGLVTTKQRTTLRSMTSPAQRYQTDHSLKRHMTIASHCVPLHLPFPHFFSPSPPSVYASAQQIRGSRIAQLRVQSRKLRWYRA